MATMFPADRLHVPKIERSSVPSSSLTPACTVYVANLLFKFQGGLSLDIPLTHQIPPVYSTLPTDTSLDNFTMDMKNLIKKIQDLSHLGIEDRKITLPKICVVGDQSTGKSSLIEGISEIKVPREEGTCTRCPLEINLSQSDEPWKCVIHLSRRYWFDPESRMRKVPKKGTLGPWQPIGDQDDQRFIELTDRNEIENAIRCAQYAILNPTMNPEDFLPDRIDPSPGLFVKFSPNAVRLDISGPDFPNLSFYDLPGVISQAELENETYLVNLVENLVNDYVSQKNCIVLLTLPMTDDATNSRASRIVRNVNATGRTLGVLTKPDLRPQGASFNQWQDILQGEKFQLGYGYYVIRNNSDPKVSHEQAREEEDNFFSQHLWKVELATLKDQFGIKNLQTALSEHLKGQILESLPSIIDNVNEKAKAIDDELKTLPNPPTEDVQRILWAKTSALERKVEEILDGTASPKQTSVHKKTLQEQWNTIVLDFQTALAKTRPIIDLHAPKDKEDLAEIVDSDCEMHIVEVKVSPKKRKLPVSTPTESASNGEAPKQSPYSTKIFEGSKHVRLSLELLSELKIRSNTVGVPNQLDPRAIENLNKKSVEHWDTLLEIFMKATHGLLHGMLLAALEEEFVPYRQTGLYQELSKILKGYLKKVRVDHLDFVKDYCKSEREIPFTMAQNLHQDLMMQTLKDLNRRRLSSRASCYLRVRGHDMTDDKVAEKIKKITIEQLCPDRYSQEIHMMAVSVPSDLVLHQLTNII
jgi:predicted transport protein